MPSLCRRFDGFEFVVVVLGSNVRAVSQFFTRGRGPVHSFLPAKLNDCCNGSANGVDIMHQQDGEGQHHSDVNPPLRFLSSTVFGVEERSTPPLILLTRYDHKTATPPHKHDNQNYPADGSELNSVWRRLRAYLDRHGARIPSSVPFIPPPSPLLVHLRLRKNTKNPREKSIFFSSTNRHRCIFSAHQYCLSKSRSLQGVGGAKKLSHQPLGSWVRTTKIEENSKSQTKIKATDY